MHKYVVDENDRAELVRLLSVREIAKGMRQRSLRRYYEGRIDGHCLNNAIGVDTLHEVATAAGFTVDWEPTL